MTGRCVYDSNPHIKQVVAWCRTAKAYADARGFAAPCDDFEYQFMLGFMHKGLSACLAVERLQTWRDQSARVSTEETPEREEAQ